MDAVTNARELHDAKQPTAAPDGPEAEGAEPGGPDPRATRWQQVVKAATKWNASHPELVGEFNKVTGGKCAGRNAGVSVRAVRQWQMEHGLSPDGKVGKATVEAARAEAPEEEPPAGADGAAAGAGRSAEQAAGRPKGASSPATIGAPPADEEDGLAGEIVAGGNTVSQRHRPKEKDGEATEEGGRWAGEGADKGLDGVAGEGLAGTAVAKGAAAIARMPHVVHLLREKRYKEAVEYIREVLGYKEDVEVLKLAAEHMSIPLEEIAEAVPMLGAIGRGIEIAAEGADIVLVGLEFQKGALEALAKAHEEGERDNLIYLYSSAWAHAFLWGAGSYSNPGAIDDRQKRAVVDGNKEGAATAGSAGERAPELGKKLMKDYGSPENAERALVDALLKRAGIEGVRFHEGKEGKGKGRGEQTSQRSQAPQDPDK
jgi:peptidoglycan hydrolase-like protein with peptidoglycan-binding domain